MNKPELIVSVDTYNQIHPFINAGIDGLVITDNRFSLTGNGNFTQLEMERIIEECKASDVNIYLQVDAVMPNELLEEFELFIEEIRLLPFDGIRVSDLGAFRLLKENLPNMALHLVDGMVLTNVETINFWAYRGIDRVRVAHELTLDEVVEIKAGAKCGIEVLVHGAPLMFTSRRRLIDNFLDFKARFGQNIELPATDNQLFDEERQLYYPIFQNQHGTHIFSGSDVCMIDDLDELLNVDSLYLEKFTYKDDDFIKLIELYRFAIDLFATNFSDYKKARRALQIKALKRQAANREINTGFFYKPTIYKNKEEV